MPKIIENVRETILAEARVMLLEKNYAEMNIRDISKRCGIGIGTFYNYFSNKEQLVTEIFRMDWMLVSRVISEAEHSTISFKDKCHKVFDALDVFIQQYTDVFFELAASGNHPRSCQETNKFDRIYSQMTTLIANEQQAGRINSPMTPDQLSRFLISSFIFASKQRYIDFETLYSGFNL